MKKKKQRARRRPLVEVDVGKMHGILDRAREGPLSQEECNTVKSAIDVMARALTPPRTSEKLEDILSYPEGHEDSNSPDSPEQQPDSSVIETSKPQEDPKPRKPGHGRNGASAYTGADQVHVPHPDLQAGCLCPECQRGKVYPLKDPSPRVRVVGMAPFHATVHLLEQMRCNLCGQCWVAPEPEGIGPDKYDETVPAMVALLRYGKGIPFNRIEQLQLQAGVPLPASVQWGLVEAAAAIIKPVLDEMVRQGAQKPVVQNDDSFMRILKMERPEGDKRTGTHTTCIVARGDEHPIVLFMSGRQIAGENLSDVLQHRAQDLGPVIHMCDGLNHNHPKQLPDGVQTLLANCIPHGRRKFVEIVDNFPSECRHVIESLGQVFANDDIAKTQNLSPEARLKLHQELSQPIMKELRSWLTRQLDEKLVEANSSLGKAMKYLLTHWQALTLFLRVAGAPIDNNIVERGLKKAILHRKNSLFYLTMNGAQVGDLFMSLIHTCELNQVNAFDYLVALLRHPLELRVSPAEWMPWNYKAALAPAAPD